MTAALFLSLLLSVWPLEHRDTVKTEIKWPRLLTEDAMPARNGYTVALVGDIMMGTTFPCPPVIKRISSAAVRPAAKLSCPT